MDKISNRLQFFESFPAVMQQFKESFGDELPDDNHIKELVKGFLIEAYQNLTQTIEKIESALPFMSNSVDYNFLKETTEKIKDFLEKYKGIFIAAGIADEEELRNKILILREKEIMIKKFLTHWKPWLSKRRTVKQNDSSPFIFAL